MTAIDTINQAIEKINKARADLETKKHAADSVIADLDRAIEKQKAAQRTAALASDIETYQAAKAEISDLEDSKAIEHVKLEAIRDQSCTLPDEEVDRMVDALRTEFDAEYSKGRETMAEETSKIISTGEGIEADREAANDALRRLAAATGKSIAEFSDRTYPDGIFWPADVKNIYSYQSYLRSKE